VSFPRIVPPTQMRQGNHNQAPSRYRFSAAC
jgi:hypothetical protein